MKKQAGDQTVDIHGNKKIIYTIGTVVRIGNANAMIIGYRIMANEESTELLYYLVEFPFGYISMNDVKIVPASVCSAVYEGMESEVSVLYLDYLEKLLGSINNRDLSVEEHYEAKFMDSLSVYPIGSVIKKIDDDDLIMIIGFNPVVGDKEMKGSYIGVQYPGGFYPECKLVVLRNEDIEAVLFDGYVTADIIDFLNGVFE